MWIHYIKLRFCMHARAPVCARHTRSSCQLLPLAMFLAGATLKLIAAVLFNVQPWGALVDKDYFRLVGGVPWSNFVGIVRLVEFCAFLAPKLIGVLYLASQRMCCLRCRP